MTDTTITPVEGTDAPPDTTPPPTPEPAPAPPAVVEHTPGGWPVVPLAVTGTNATTTLLAAAALVGGPAAFALAATGAVVLGTVAATRHRRDRKINPKNKATSGRTARAGSAAGAALGGRRGAGRVPTQSRNGSAGTTKSGGRGRGAGSRATAGSSPAGKKSAGLNRARKTSTAGTSTPSSGTASRRSAGRVGQVKALRDTARQASPSRATRRNDTTGARRSVADARRQARADRRSASRAQRGPVGRAVGRAAGRIGRARGAAIERARTARDRRAAGRLDAQRDQVRKAPARKAARRALRRSAARFQRRRLLAALLAGALGIVGMLTSPLGRKLGIPWLVHPGRRLYARLMCTAAEQRAARDEAIRAALQDDEAAIEAEAGADGSEQIGDQAERPAGLVPAAPTTSENTEGENMSGFRFEEHAAEMETAANSYDPENAMEILAMVEGLPAALTSVANVMRILAERADSEFPLEKEVADGFNDIFGALMSAVAVAEDMGPLFRTAHEQDIARHEDPRNGTEAEKGWNV